MPSGFIASGLLRRGEQLAGAAVRCKYMPGVDTVLISCSTAGNPVGVAVDQRGNVFVSVGSAIEEFKHGLVNSHCTPTQLPVTLDNPSGMAFDTNRNLLVADGSAAAVDIIAPPYTTVTGTLGSGWTQPTSVTVIKAGTRAYVADFGAGTVSVLTYPAGSTLTTLDGANGLEFPYSAVNSNNYVP